MNQRLILTTISTILYPVKVRSLSSLHFSADHFWGVFLPRDIKQSNWFAAGQEVQRALLSLSDGAFRVYLYICLNASRKTGRISLSYSSLAQTLGRSRRSIASHMDELRKLGICHIDPAVNQHHSTEIEVCDCYWPYTKPDRAVEASEFQRYLQQIKKFVARRSCIRSTATAADERFVGDLFARQVPIQQIERAIALGCCRKYVSLLNGTNSGPIFSLVYFGDVIEEVCDPEMPAGYWAYIMPELVHLEEKWIAQSKGSADARFAPPNGPKNEETR